jgi:hypothetical protein
MQDRQPINDSYYCGRFRPDSIVSVLTGNSYVVAEYDERTGDIRWQRVVNASQREGIHNWLKEHFPVHAPALPVPLKISGRLAPKAAAPKVVSAKVQPKEEAKAAGKPKGHVDNKLKVVPSSKVAGRKRQLASA